jgi:hypothetical protein
MDIMKYFYAMALLVGLGVGAVSGVAFGQSMPGTGQAGMPGPQIQPPVRTPDIAPPALPGAGAAPGLATAPQPAKPITGDPTTALFDAINKNDYNAAQDALSRGADLTAQDALGETPIALSVDLNRNSITFMLLSARNETGTDSGGVATGQAALTQTPASSPVRHHLHAEPANLVSPPMSTNPAYGTASGGSASGGSASGTPNPSAGFNGFSNQ